MWIYMHILLLQHHHLTIGMNKFGQLIDFRVENLNKLSVKQAHKMDW